MWMGSPAAIARGHPRKQLGDDGGCFEAALRAVRTYGGVLEHPMHSKAWDFFGLRKPPRDGGWVRADEHGFTCCVEQGRYGHWARKPTWLYAVRCDLPELEWGHSEPRFPDWAVERYGLQKCKRMGEMSFRGGGVDSRARNATPEPFRDILLALARGGR